MLHYILVSTQELLTQVAREKKVKTEHTTQVNTNVRALDTEKPT